MLINEVKQKYKQNNFKPHLFTKQSLEVSPPPCLYEWHISKEKIKPERRNNLDFSKQLKKTNAIVDQNIDLPYKQRMGFVYDYE